MKHIMGGDDSGGGSGSCCVRGHWSDGTYHEVCNISQASAQLAEVQWDQADPGAHFYWCCASC